MVTITYIEHTGTEHVVDVPSGRSVMHAAVLNRVPGIVGSCLGDGACATCHVYVDEPWRGRCGERSAQEKRTLRFAREPGRGSRLSCQIKVACELDGLVVRLPSRQF